MQGKHQVHVTCAVASTHSQKGLHLAKCSAVIILKFFIILPWNLHFYKVKSDRIEVYVQAERYTQCKCLLF
jgi:hypothetical protein